MADPARARKIADRIKVIVAEYLEFRLKDERLGFVTITDARMTGDLQHASVFYTVFGSDEERKRQRSLRPELIDGPDREEAPRRRARRRADERDTENGPQRVVEVVAPEQAREMPRGTHDEDASLAKGVSGCGFPYG